MISGLTRPGEAAPDASLARSTNGLLHGLGAIVMAAGQGTRMRSKLVKVLHPLAGRPMLVYALDLAGRCAGEGVVVVVGYQGDRVKAAIEAYATASRGTSNGVVRRRSGSGREKGLTAHLSGAQVTRGIPPILIAEQGEQLGTGHAVMQARTVFERSRGGPAERFLILNGDTPLLGEATLRELVRLHQSDGAAVTLLTARLHNPQGYGRVVRAQDGRAGRDGQVLRVVEDRDATETERGIPEINVGTYVVEGQFLFEILDQLRPVNAQQEYYLTDIIAAAVQRGQRVAALVAPNADEALGINTRQQLAAADRVIRGRINARWMAAGVTLRDPDSTFIDADVEIGQDTVLYPQVALEGRTRIGQDCVVHAHSRITDSRLGDRVTVLDSCVMRESELHDDAVIGPFAHLRPGSVLKRSAKVGNFVEMKKTDLGEGSKANHLSYLGDAKIGKGVNIGAGTITCNYDGAQKHETVIEDRVFVGSDTQFIAPVTVGRGAVVAAGSTITSDVPADALAISRPQQINREGWVSRRRALPAPGRHAARGARPAAKAKAFSPEPASGRREIRRSRREVEPRASRSDPRAAIKQQQKKKRKT
jgi:bifunctional UDP-N-acetylglucosamine pyrophosphorylase/glucosamine-1-phosphate N-acetyltransferase